MLSVLRGCGLSALVAWCAQAYPQTAAPGLVLPSAASPQQTIQEGLRRQEERARELQKAQEPDASELTPARRAAPPPGFPQELRCFVINEIGLAGPDASRFRWLADAAMPYLRRCVGVQGLSYIASALDGVLRDAGFATTRVVLPPQSLEAGQLQLRVEAGRVGAIRMVDAGNDQQPDDQGWGTWRNAFPTAIGDVLNVRDLEQGVENMKRLPSQTVATRLQPGDDAGTSVIVIERKSAGMRDRLRGGVSIDNAGSSSLGRAQLSANVAFDNPAGLNDVVSASFNTNAQQPQETHRSQSVGLNYSVPWGYNLLSVNASHSRFAQYVQGTTVRFLSSGSSDSAEVKAQRTVWRGASGKLGVYAALSTRRAESYLDDVEIVVQRRRTTNVETGVNFRQLFESAFLDVDLGYRRGMPWRGAQDDLPSAAAGGPTLRPHIWLLNATLGGEVKLGSLPVQFSTALRMQQTRDATLSIDQFAIGGRSSVRGFDGDSVLIAESGAVLRSELTTPLALWDGVAMQAVAAFDIGHVHGPSAVFLAGKSLAGMAAGLRGRRGDTQFEALLAVPLRQPGGFVSRPFSVYATVTQSF